MSAAVMRSAGFVWRCGAFSFELGRPKQPLVMGILNVTPDSFSDGGQDAHTDDAIARGLKLAEQGAQIVDIGGESTRPGYTPVSIDEELARTIPVVQALAAAGVCVSIDTHKPAVMRAALAAGAAIINDVNALRHNESLYLAMTTDCGIVIMDGFSTADQMDKQAGIGLHKRLATRHSELLDEFITSDRIVIDPGLGFDKTYDNNLECMTLMPALVHTAPVLIGISNKSVLGKITGRAVAGRAAANVAATLIAAQRGAAVLRVHDVAGTVDMLKVWRALG